MQRLYFSTCQGVYTHSMKHLAAVSLSTFFLLLVSCKKDRQYPMELTGVWELRFTASMFGRSYDPGTGNILIFTSGGDFRSTLNGVASESGTYYVMNDGNVEEEICLVGLTEKFDKAIRFSNNGPKRKGYFNIAGDSLTIYSGCFSYDAWLKSVYKFLRETE